MSEMIKTIYKGLTYNESWSFVVVNYSLVVVSLFPFLIIRLRNFGKSIRITLWIAVALQITLWLVLKAIGVSIVWNTMLGAMMVDFIRFRKYLKPQYWVVIGLTLFTLLSADIYYLLTLPMITSIAHLAAILLGAIYEPISGLKRNEFYVKPDFKII